MKKLVALLIPALLLTGCAAESTPLTGYALLSQGLSANCDSFSGGDAIEQVSVEGEFGAEPKIEFPSPLVGSGIETKVFIEGKGGALVGAQRVALHFTGFNASTGEQFQGSEFGTNDYIIQGQFRISNRPDCVLTTLLGSCVAACVWDPVMQLGGMNHFLLPDGGQGSDSGRYGSFAMDLLIGELIKRGANRSTMEAKVFGGGRVLAGMEALNVGERNAQFVRDYLRAENIPVLAADLNDTCPRKIAYFPTTGRALVRKLQSVSPRIARVEQQYSSALKTKPLEGDIELF